MNSIETSGKLRNCKKDLPSRILCGKIIALRGCSTVGQSASFTSKRSGVRAPPSPPKQKGHPTGGFLFCLQKGARSRAKKTVRGTVFSGREVQARDCVARSASRPPPKRSSPSIPTKTKKATQRVVFCFVYRKGARSRVKKTVRNLPQLACAQKKYRTKEPIRFTQMGSDESVYFFPYGIKIAGFRTVPSQSSGGACAAHAQTSSTAPAPCR